MTLKKIQQQLLSSSRMNCTFRKSILSISLCINVALLVLNTTARKTNR